MPDFYISAVKYNQAQTHIEKVRTHKVTINNQGKKSFDTTGSENTRKFIAELILTGKVSFKTLTKKSNFYSEGQDVRVAETT